MKETYSIVQKRHKIKHDGDSWKQTGFNANKVKNPLSKSNKNKSQRLSSWVTCIFYKLSIKIAAGKSTESNKIYEVKLVHNLIVKTLHPEDKCLLYFEICSMMILGFN